MSATTIHSGRGKRVGPPADYCGRRSRGPSQCDVILAVLRAAKGGWVSADALVAALYPDPANRPRGSRGFDSVLNAIRRLRDYGAEIFGGTRTGFRFWMPPEADPPPALPVPEFRFCKWRKPSGRICDARFKPAAHWDRKCPACRAERQGDDLTVFSIGRRDAR